ncbi:cytochrome P450 [Podospora didyma]|uniref:Cytochrome P450 n=1 Tax=Podospora didyma TaxID=330526 RepID=A0AAE0N589_9PEZI|nr:cytochrome P450 [Podospora didyma]
MGILDVFGTSHPWLWLATSTSVAYLFATTVYNLYFHPAARIPGPKLSGASYVVYAYHWIRGRYPWYQEKLLHQYGDVVRVAPNEVVFFRPQAAMDIYSPAVKNLELFRKTDAMDFGAGDLGYLWETDPVKRKAVAKKILPAFSSKAIRDKEPVVHRYLDFFVEKMKEVGGGSEGALMNDWLMWLGCDMGADLAYSREFNQMRDGKESDFVKMFRSTSFAGTLFQLARKLPIVGLIAPFCIPLGVWGSIPAVMRANAAEVHARIEKRGKTTHKDFMEYMIPNDAPPPTSKKEITHLEQVAIQMFIAGFDPVQIVFYAALFFALKHPKAHAALAKEIRDAFGNYEEITADSTAALPYLVGFVNETLRVHLTTPTGMPRVSPGATVDGVYVPKGASPSHSNTPTGISTDPVTQVVVQLSTFTAQRHEDYFTDPLEFRPQRWLPAEHPLYETRYANDNLKAYFPFSLGPRQCTGREIAWSQTRLFLGKVLWTFDVEGVRGLQYSFDRDFSCHMMWNRPELWVRFLPRKQ